jgi:tRNA(Ile)-lysidine synthase
MTKTSNTILQHRLLQSIRDNSLCRPDDRLIVAVSGGADSVALLDLLATLPDFPLRLVVAHLNHHLRGTESDGDETFVKDLAAQYGLPYEVTHAAIRQIAQQTGRSLEEAGREARYAFFEQLRQDHHASAIAVAHHADDQAETFLLRLLRGAGTTGLAAMAPVNQARVIRPLLEITRLELRDHLASRKLIFREDASNTDRDFLRNRIRHELLPLLNDYSPGISGRLAATAGLIREDENLLTSCTDTAFRQLSVTGKNWAAIPRIALAEQHQALRLRLFRTSIKTVLGDLNGFERLHFSLLNSFLNGSKTGASINLPRGLVALLTAEHLLFTTHELLRPAPPCRCLIEGPGSYDLDNGLSLAIEYASAPRSWPGLPDATTYVDFDQAPFPWQVRPTIQGERLEPLGMKGSRSIQDILTDRKLPRHLRACLPLVCHNTSPLWLAGILRTRHALIKSEMKQGVRVTLSGQDQIPLFP